MPDSKIELLPGTLELLILKSLAIGPLHGYAIARRIQQTSQDVLQVEEGSLYPALHRLEKRGLVDAEWGPSEANRRAKFYRLTKDGRAEQRVQEETWERVSSAVSRVLKASAKGA
ncbi:MAG TPA: PadR family transcriptional regulator [Planctomycetota bacterium]|nr:PadR family transcriptional regulator [Planctomycetota bacterium]